MDELQPTPGPVRAGKGRFLSGAAEVAAAALATGETAVAAARIAGVHERTVRKWLDRPEFVARVEQLRGEAVGQAVSRLSGSLTLAADALKKLIGHRDPGVRFRAARAVIELGMKLKEHAELEARLRDLEMKLAGKM